MTNFFVHARSSVVKNLRNRAGSPRAVCVKEITGDDISIPAWLLIEKGDQRAQVNGERLQVGRQLETLLCLWDRIGEPLENVKFVEQMFFGKIEKLLIGVGRSPCHNVQC